MTKDESAGWEWLAGSRQVTTGPVLFDGWERICHREERGDGKTGPAGSGLNGFGLACTGGDRKQPKIDEKEQRTWKRSYPGTRRACRVVSPLTCCTHLVSYRSQSHRVTGSQGQPQDQLPATPDGWIASLFPTRLLCDLTPVSSRLVSS